MNTKARSFALRGNSREKTLAVSSGTLAIALGAVALLGTNAVAQEVFRSSRPSYTRNQFRANTSSRADFDGGGSNWIPRSQSRGPGSHVPEAAYYEPVGDFGVEPPVARRLVSDSGQPSPAEFERVRAAWENYRREAIRYQARFGDEKFAANSFGAHRAVANRVGPDRVTARNIAANRVGPGLAGSDSFESTPWRPMEDRAHPRFDGTFARPSLSRNASLRPNAGHLACREFGCRGGDRSPQGAGQRPRLERGVPVLPYQEGGAFADGDFDREPALGYSGGEADQRPSLRPGRPGTLRRSFPPNAPFQEDFQGVRTRDNGSRRIKTREVLPRASEDQPNGRLFSTPLPKFDPAKLASRASNFFRTNLSE